MQRRLRLSICPEHRALCVLWPVRAGNADVLDLKMYKYRTGRAGACFFGMESGLVRHFEALKLLLMSTDVLCFGIDIMLSWSFVFHWFLSNTQTHTKKNLETDLRGASKHNFPLMWLGFSIFCSINVLDHNRNSPFSLEPQLKAEHVGSLESVQLGCCRTTDYYVSAHSHL